MKTVYFSIERNAHLTRLGWMSDSDLDIFDALEREWEESKPNFTIVQLLEIFPEGKPIARKKFKDEVEKHKETLRTLQLQRRDIINKKVPATPRESRWFYEEYIMKLIEEEIERVQKWLSKDEFYFNINKKWNDMEEIKLESSITEGDIETAKQMPIENFYSGKLRKLGDKLWGNCPFHNEKHPSFVIYIKQNSWHCFGGCSTGGDVISFVQKLMDKPFVETVKVILGR